LTIGIMCQLIPISAAPRRTISLNRMLRGWANYSPDGVSEVLFGAIAPRSLPATRPTAFTIGDPSTENR
jgi:hypothetical protein